MNPPTVNELYGYVQERCLWQFFSRAWDRTENIEGILGKVTDMLTGKPLVLETTMDRLFYADAKVLVEALRGRFPGLLALDGEQVKSLFEGVKERVSEIAVSKSKNRELYQKLY